ncbi:hypothetical protein MRX96_037909 [Rhipicephalus microplus]
MGRLRSTIIASDAGRIRTRSLHQALSTRQKPLYVYYHHIYVEIQIEVQLRSRSRSRPKTGNTWSSRPLQGGGSQSPQGPSGVRGSAGPYQAKQQKFLIALCFLTSQILFLFPSALLAFGLLASCLTFSNTFY